MTVSASDRVEVLIIRAWIEDGSSEPLRAQLRISTDVSAGFERTLTFARAEDIGVAVQEWLADIVRGAGDPHDRSSVV